MRSKSKLDDYFSHRSGHLLTSAPELSWTLLSPGTGTRCNHLPTPPPCPLEHSEPRVTPHVMSAAGSRPPPFNRRPLLPPSPTQNKLACGGREGEHPRCCGAINAPARERAKKKNLLHAGANAHDEPARRARPQRRGMPAGAHLLIAHSMTDCTRALQQVAPSRLTSDVQMATRPGSARLGEA